MADLLINTADDGSFATSVFLMVNINEVDAGTSAGNFFNKFLSLDSNLGLSADRPLFNQVVVESPHSLKLVGRSFNHQIADAIVQLDNYVDGAGGGSGPIVAAGGAGPAGSGSHTRWHSPGAGCGRSRR